MKRISIVILTAGLAVGATTARKQEAHPPGCAELAGTVSRELMERPVGLREGVGKLHQKVSTESAAAQDDYDQGITFLASYVWVEAARAFHEALRKDPALAMAELGLAKAYAGADADEDARAHLTKAKELAGKEKVTPGEMKWIDLAIMQRDAIDAPSSQTQLKHEAYKKAIEELIKLDPSDPLAWILRGNAEERGPWGRGQGGEVGSIAYYETALMRDPGNLAAHHFLVHSFEHIGRHAEAAEHGRAYLAASPNV
ncbi:MAG TPA: tetratricopeptide repeat protein, partial [Candidatus Polarisedimenticolia bacterium]|nr:tetratricopeptide repeat protein [Candidatus Polarisedimenticolia bacterium]